MRKTFAGIVAGIAMGAATLTACGGKSYSGYDYVYDTHTHHYVYVTDSYYHSHRSYFSGTPRHVSNNTVINNHNHYTIIGGAPTVSHATAPRPTKTSIGHKIKCKIVRRHRTCR